jgi:hypothetical protein
MILHQPTPYFLVLLQFAPFYMFIPSFYLLGDPYMFIPSFYLLGDPPSLLVVRIPIHSCPWFAINCSSLAASPTPRHPTDQVTYIHRRHQQHQVSCLIQEQSSKVLGTLSLFCISADSRLN